MQNWASKIIGFVGNVIKYGCITHCTFEYLGDFVVCNGPSMQPTLFSNDILLTERISARFYKISKGDIIIAKCPTNPNLYICKRVLGLPGDIINATIPYSGRLHDEINARANKEGSYDDKQKTSVIVPPGQVWLEGDNPANSTDSRFYGPVPMGLVKSRVLFRLWPLNGMTVLA